MSSLLQVKYKMLLEALSKRADGGEVIEFKESVSTWTPPPPNLSKIFDIQTKQETDAEDRPQTICFSESKISKIRRFETKTGWLTYSLTHLLTYLLTYLPRRLWMCHVLPKVKALVKTAPFNRPPSGG